MGETSLNNVNLQKHFSPKRGERKGVLVFASKSGKCLVNISLDDPSVLRTLFRC
jgi:hypothetical protein